MKFAKRLILVLVVAMMSGIASASPYATSVYEYGGPNLGGANNPYGIDLLVFGNSFYSGSGYVSDETNMNTYQLGGGGWFENVTVSVSQGPEYEGQDPSEWTWYTYSSSPYGDNNRTGIQFHGVSDAAAAGDKATQPVLLCVFGNYSLMAK